jgi:tRNA(Arg) A34 adenosine deaminase TadA
MKVYYMMDRQKLLTIAKKQAMLSKDTGKNKSYKVGAVLFNSKGKVIVQKHNSYKTQFLLDHNFYIPNNRRWYV